MKKIIICFMLLGILTACAAQPTESLLPEDGASGRTPAQQAAVTALSRTLNLPPGQITLISTEAMDWPDGCLGIPQEGEVCTEAIVPGYKIILQAGDALYEIRTNADGSVLIEVDAPVTFATLEETLINRLASNLGLGVDEVQVTSVSEMTFEDACLGVALPDTDCAPMSIPGKLVVLQAQGVDYSYRVSADSSFIQPANLLLTWRREGGIAGFCDLLVVYLSGEVRGSQCHSKPGEATGTFASLLSASEREQILKWATDLGEINLDASDPKGVSDRMTVLLEFHGAGKGTLKKDAERDLLLWAQSLFAKLYS